MSAIVKGAIETTLDVNASWKCQWVFVPKGHDDNSPAFQRREPLAAVRVPKGRLKVPRSFSRPFGIRIHGPVNPALKRWAIVICPSGTVATRRDPNSKGVTPKVD
ncbi:MAG TPA: hypothetical protein VFZ59_02700 [Verrucomicrobiae bacterium]|nr:hypothetical protein [Verrucomicrobiae bacterium]